MADNSTLNAGAGGDTYRSVDVAGIKTQVVRAAFGTGATVTDIAASSIAAGLPSQVIDGANVALGTTTDLATATTVIGRLQKLVALLAGGLPAALGANGGLKIEGVASGTAVPVSGTVALGAGAQVIGHVVADTGSTTAATQATAANLNAQVQGPAAHGASTSGNPLWLGQEAIAHGTNPTAVTAGQLTKWYANRAGVPFVMGGHPNVVTIELAFTAAQTDVAIVTIGAGLKIVVTRCSFVTSHANTVDVAVRVGFALATTPTTTGVVLSHPNVAAGSGVIEGNGGGMLGVGADNEDLRITATVPTTGSARVIVSYYTIES